MSRKRKPIDKPLVQSTLDFGQKIAGAYKCSECGMFYNTDDLEDCQHHKRFHLNAVSPRGKPIKRWKNQRVLEDFLDGSRILLIPQDDRVGQAHFESLRVLMDKELGTDLSPVKGLGKSGPVDQASVFLYVRRSAVVGCCLAEQISEAFRMCKRKEISESDSKENRLPVEPAVLVDTSSPCAARCGIRRIWVSKNFRRQGIARTLLDVVRQNIIYGHPVGRDFIAFTDPTSDGRKFASQYTGREDFLIY